MKLRPYQETAKNAIIAQWKAGVQKTLLVLPTGTGKTIVFSALINDIVAAGGKVLILAHRAELLQQAADKLAKVTGLGCAVEKAEQSALDTWYNVVVGSVQTLCSDKRRSDWDDSHFTHIIVDECHHGVTKSYTAVLNHFKNAKVLGVTATADRGDKRNLGEVFETLAYEYSLPRAIREGYLVKLKAMTLPVKINLDDCAMQSGDFKLSDLDDKLAPYLVDIAKQIQEHTADRKTVVFLPLVKTSQKFVEILRSIGINCREVNGESTDRAETLAWFDKAGKGAVLCNAMLLTEGWDQPDVDCICVLRGTKVRALYCQMVGRGTRLSPGKDDLLILDFLWHSDRHELVRPAHLVCENADISKRVSEIMAEEAEDKVVDVMDALEEAEGKATNEREEALRKLLEEQKHRKRTLVDPLQFEYSADPEHHEFTPDMNNLRDLAPPSDAQKNALEKAGICPDEVTCQGHASKLLDMVAKRRVEGLTTPKQIRLLERYGFNDVGNWQFEHGKQLIDRLAANQWRVPNGVKPNEYKPKPVDAWGGM